ncbi:hypothetical protein M0805_007267 [Coniferiporia weirii]|nr:hypothetical protein M0805_007267 [Coniferiporia weirii]
MTSIPLALLFCFIFLSCVLPAQCRALTISTGPDSRSKPIFHRQDGAATPSFPSSPASCPICAQNYANINSCAAAAPVLANFTNVIFNPGAFIDVIECACTDTFQSAYPQCVDCFTKTNQTSFLSAPASSLPGILSGIQKVCALESTLIGNVSSVDGEVSSSGASASSTAGDATQTGAARGLRASGTTRTAWIYAAALVAGAVLLAI